MGDQIFNSTKYNFMHEMFNCEYNELTIPKNDNYTNNENKCNFMKHYNFSINDASFKELNEFLYNNELNPKYFFISLYGYIINKYSRQDIIYTSLLQIDSNFNNKNLIEIFDKVQPFIINFDKVNSLNELYKNIENILNTYKKEEISFINLKEQLNLLNLNNVIIYEKYNENSNIEYSLFDEDKDINIKGNTNYDIIFKIKEDIDNYKFDIYFIEDKYDKYLINNILQSYKYVISNKSNFFKYINEIEYIPEKELKKIIYDFNDNESECNNDI